MTDIRQKGFTRHLYHSSCCPSFGNQCLLFVWKRSHKLVKSKCVYFIVLFEQNDSQNWKKNIVWKAFCNLLFVYGRMNAYQISLYRTKEQRTDHFCYVDNVMYSSLLICLLSDIWFRTDIMIKSYLLSETQWILSVVNLIGLTPGIFN